MSDFESAAGIDEIVKSNPGIDGNQFSEAQDAVAALRRSGFARPSYRLDSPYERCPADLPESKAAGEVDEVAEVSVRR